MSLSVSVRVCLRWAASWEPSFPVGFAAAAFALACVASSASNSPVPIASKHTTEWYAHLGSSRCLPSRLVGPLAACRLSGSAQCPWWATDPFRCRSRCWYGGPRRLAWRRRRPQRPPLAGEGIRVRLAADVAHLSRGASFSSDRAILGRRITRAVCKAFRSSGQVHRDSIVNSRWRGFPRAKRCGVPCREYARFHLNIEN